MNSLTKELKSQIKGLLDEVIQNPKIQGHICINNSEIFEKSLNNGIYGFPAYNNMDLLTTWRAISSLYNIGPFDLIFFYRTKSINIITGSQEIHGLYRIKTQDNRLSRLFHKDDEIYFPKLPTKNNKTKFCQCRFLFESVLDEPISIKNNLQNEKGNRNNNNLQIIKGFMESKFWGFRHPAVMNIGAARKKSIVAISNKQLQHLLNMMLDFGENRNFEDETILDEYNFDELPQNAIVLDDLFLEENIILNKEVELYAYINNALKNPYSKYHSKLLEDLNNINKDIFSKPFEEINHNVILECLITPHIQEEIDILICDQSEKNFLILEIKIGQITKQNIDQTEKYLQLLKILFKDADIIAANVIGASSEDNLHTSTNIKLVKFEKKEEGFIELTEI